MSNRRTEYFNEFETLHPGLEGFSLYGGYVHMSREDYNKAKANLEAAIASGASPMAIGMAKGALTKWELEEKYRTGVLERPAPVVATTTYTPDLTTYAGRLADSIRKRELAALDADAKIATEAAEKGITEEEYREEIAPPVYSEEEKTAAIKLHGTVFQQDYWTRMKMVQ